jgi:hypothetical protein
VWRLGIRDKFFTTSAGRPTAVSTAATTTATTAAATAAATTAAAAGQPGADHFWRSCNKRAGRAWL